MIYDIIHHVDPTPEVKTVKYNGTIEEWMAEQQQKDGVEEEKQIG